MFVIVKVRMHERDNTQQEKDDPKNHGEAFHNANTTTIGPFVNADVFLRHTPAPDWRRGTADFQSGAGKKLRTACGSGSSSSSGFLGGLRGGGSLAAALGLRRR